MLFGVTVAKWTISGVQGEHGDADFWEVDTCGSGGGDVMNVLSLAVVEDVVSSKADLA